MKGPLDKESIEWSRMLFSVLKDGAEWGVPRSRLVFTKRGGELHLTHVAEAGTRFIREWQKEDFRCIAKSFEAAGVKVVDSVGLCSPQQNTETDGNP